MAICLPLLAAAPPMLVVSSSMLLAPTPAAVDIRERMEAERLREASAARWLRLMVEPDRRRPTMGEPGGPASPPSPSSLTWKGGEVGASLWACVARRDGSTRGGRALPTFEREKASRAFFSSSSRFFRAAMRS